MPVNIVFILFTLIIILLLSYKKIQSVNEYFTKLREIDFKKRTNLDLWKLTRISAPAPFLFGLEKYIETNSVFYFDKDNLYIIKYDKPVIKHSLSTISEVIKTHLNINERRIWKIIVYESGKQIIYKIKDEYWNFELFLDKINENPNSIVS
ncbi:hypothetical protein LNQ49_20975 [Flavobacterium sp. F-65]|uniref:Uncharacterized protein n=1 Tax=Flavobacterium pisciphilum TaxID=2893755 RepID=A0ABS8MZ60_9FLAO|nr:hypothetical protein [Flavobacterium sp. F-65]MCC9074064.1 hypothetical protein [Flavobacterium sp. F-65]